MTASHDHHNGKSILSDVARHERDLLAKLEGARDEARKIVERARADAAKHISDEAARAEADAAKIRNDAARVREAEFASAVAAAESRLAGQRTAAMARVKDMAKDVLGMFLPKGGAS